MTGDIQGNDQSLTCVDCGVQFTFTARDQAFYKEKGFQAPRRCKDCRDKRKTGGPTPSPFGGGGGRNSGGGGGRGDSGGGAGGAPAGEHFKVVCSSCGIETTVPFKPDPNRPVFCRTCYSTNKRK